MDVELELHIDVPLPIGQVGVKSPWHNVITDLGSPSNIVLRSENPSVLRLIKLHSFDAEIPCGHIEIPVGSVINHYRSLN